MTEIVQVTREAAQMEDNQGTSEPLIISQGSEPDRIYEGGLIRLNSVSTSAATPSEVTFENIRYAVTLGHRFFHEHPEFKKVKDKSQRIALVGGGPSLRDNLEELRTFDTILACGSVYDYLIDNNIIPVYAAACDPDPITANYLTKPHVDTEFLIATGCDKKVFDVLKDNKVTIWHCFSDENSKEFLRLDPNYQAIGGGCTVGLRAISIAIMLGYTNIHFFGFDSCLGDKEEHHVYPFTDESEYLGLGTIYDLRIGRSEERRVGKECRL